MSSCSSNDGTHLLNLVLSSLLGTKSLLCELSSSLISEVSDQIDDSSLVWRQSSDLLDQIPDEGGPLGGPSLSLGWSWSDLLCSDLVALVQTDSNSYSKEGAFVSNLQFFRYKTEKMQTVLILWLILTHYYYNNTFLAHI